MAESGDGPKSKTAGNSAKSKSLSKEQILSKFQELRGQQRATVNKMSEIEMDRKEHEWVAWLFLLVFLLCKASLAFIKYSLYIGIHVGGHM